MPDESQQPEPEQLPFNPAIQADLRAWIADELRPSRPTPEEWAEVCKKCPGRTPEDRDLLFPPDTRPKSYKAN
jgi:hypothetical protein